MSRETIKLMEELIEWSIKDRVQWESRAVKEVEPEEN